MRRLLAALAALAVALAPPARGDIGGNPQGPGPCPYPSTGVTAWFDPVLGRGEVAYCRFPQEINGSYYVQALGDYAIAGGFAGPHGGSVVLGAGGGGSKAGFFCLAEPDNGLAFLDPARTQEAADPNPPGAWKSEIKPSKCEPKAAPAPPPEPAPAYEPPPAMGALSPVLPQPDQFGRPAS